MLIEFLQRPDSHHVAWNRLSRPRSSSPVLHLLQFLVFGSQKNLRFALMGIMGFNIYLSKMISKKKSPLSTATTHHFLWNSQKCWYVGSHISHPSETRFYSRASEGAGSHGTGLLGFYACRSETRKVKTCFCFVKKIPKTTGEKPTKDTWMASFFRGRTLLVSGSVGFFLSVVM